MDKIIETEMIENNEGNVEVKIQEHKSISETLSESKRTSNNFIKILPIILILIATVGMIIYIVFFYIPNIKEAIYNESFTNGSESVNVSLYYIEGLNKGYQLGQEEIISKINIDLDIPVIYEQNGNLSVNWIPLQTICGAG